MCDTFVALPPWTQDGGIIFGKNSDREPNEAQALEYHPASRHRPGTTLRCTYKQIPQAEKTHAVLISRPFWMWGAEMGANEKGVVIGNEAVFTRMPVIREGGLTGMDLLRLALERSTTAENALETVVTLLADHGQGGVCGYEDKKMAYHNSFIFADAHSAWVLETAGPLWAARQIHAAHAISNGLTIGEAYNRAHPDLIDTARKKGWLKKGQDFHFARCYSDWFFTTFSACRAREAAAIDLLDCHRGKLGVAEAIAMLRSHGRGEYRPDGHFLGNRICAHAANPLARSATQTTGSLIAHLGNKQAIFWATGTAAPCTSLFKPVWVENGGLPDIGPSPGATYDARTLWWHHESLHRSVLLDHSRRLGTYCEERDRIESRWMAEAEKTNGEARAALGLAAFSDAGQFTNQWIDQVQAQVPKRGTGWLYARYWEKQNRKAGIIIK